VDLFEAVLLEAGPDTNDAGYNGAAELRRDDDRRRGIVVTSIWGLG